MRLPAPRALRITRLFPALVVIAWVVVMAVLVNRSYLQASPSTLATDLARYGSTAVWRGIYYRGEKIGFTVSQTTRTDDGFELQEDGRLQMLLFGAASAATLRTTARVDANFVLRSFDFSLDPGTGAIRVSGAVGPAESDGAVTAGRSDPAESGRYVLTLNISSKSGTRTERRRLDEPPVLTQNLSRLLANGRLTPGARYRWMVIDPATLRNAPVLVAVGNRAIVRVGDTPMPAFPVSMDFQGLQTTSWITDTGDVVREESPLGLMAVRETAERAQGVAVPGRVQSDLLRASAVVPAMRTRIDDPRDVRHLRVTLTGVDLASFDADGVGQSVSNSVVDVRAPLLLQPSAADRDAGRYLAAEAFVESDAPEIVAEAQRAVAGVSGARARAERLTRHVNALLEKKPTVSLPSAREVLRTRVGDCNEHTVLYVALARAVGIPARIAVGLVYVHGAFYYHAWPEVYIEETSGRGLWLSVDPTLNQFPADGMHVRLLRGGIDKQAAILPLIGRMQMTVNAVELAPESERVAIGRETTEAIAANAMALLAKVPQSAGTCRCKGTSR